MAIIKNPEDLSNATNYVATVAFFCCISCVTLILKFGGFKASLNIFKGKNDKEPTKRETGLIMNGAYRTNRDEFFGNGTPIKLTPSMVNLPSCEENLHTIKPTNSTNDLSKQGISQQLHLNKRNVPEQLPGDEPKQTSKDSRRWRLRQNDPSRQNKQHLAEQKKLEKEAAKEKVKQEKYKEEAKKEMQAKARKDKRKAPTPQPVQVERNNLPSASHAEPVDLATKTNVPYSTNTLESSISRSSGPPPYTEEPQPTDGVNQTTITGNITFGKPIETSSWDLISEHRQQVSRATNNQTKNNKQTVIDLNYNFGNATQKERDNSEV